MCENIYGENGKIIKDGKIIFEADYIDTDGRFELNKKIGIVNLKTGKIIKEPLFDWIYSDGRFELNGGIGIVNMKTGKIIKEVI